MGIRMLNVVALLAFSASMAGAQPPPPPAPPTGNPNMDVITGALTPSLPQLQDGSYFRVYKYHVQPGFIYEFHLVSSSFDPFLWIQEQPNQIGVNHAIAKDDDSGGGLNSLIKGRFKRAGTIYLVVNSFSGGETGNFTLRIKRIPMNLPPNPSPSSPPGVGQGPNGQSPVGNVAAKIAALRSQIKLYDNLIKKAEKNAQDAEQQAQIALEGNRLTSYYAFLNTAKAARDQAARFRQKRNELQQQLNQLLAQS